MSNAAGLREKVAAIIAAIDDGSANQTKAVRALARAIDLLAKDIAEIEYRERCRDLAAQTKPRNPLADLFGA